MKGREGGIEFDRKKHRGRGGDVEGNRKHDRVTKDTSYQLW